jgi:hypothetical protein
LNETQIEQIADTVNGSNIASADLKEDLNGAFHKTKKLIIPPSICLLFLPPYSPELSL